MIRRARLFTKHVLPGLLIFLSPFVGLFTLLHAVHSSWNLFLVLISLLALLIPLCDMAGRLFPIKNVTGVYFAIVLAISLTMLAYLLVLDDQRKSCSPETLQRLCGPVLVLLDDEFRRLGHYPGELPDRCRDVLSDIPYSYTYHPAGKEYSLVFGFPHEWPRPIYSYDYRSRHRSWRFDLDYEIEEDEIAERLIDAGYYKP